MTTPTPAPAPAARRIALPALAAASLALGLAIVPLAAVAATSDDLAPETVEVVDEVIVEQPLVEDIQLPTLPDVLPVAPAADAPSGPIAEFTASTGRVLGTVTTTNGTPIADAAVLFNLADGSGPTGFLSTDASGQYATDELPPGDYVFAFATPLHVIEYAMPTVTAGADLELSAKLVAKQPLHVSVVNLDGSPASAHRVVLHFDGAGGSTEIGDTDADGQVTMHLEPTEYRIELRDSANTTLGWYDGDASLAAAPLPIDGIADGPDRHAHIVLGLADGEEPQHPEDPEEPYDPIECTHPLTGDTVPCDVPASELCQNPLTGAWERCEVECRSDLGLPIDCPDLPDTSTVPEYELETLAQTGANWQGVALIAGAFLVLGVGIHLAARVQRRHESR